MLRTRASHTWMKICEVHREVKKKTRNSRTLPTFSRNASFSCFLKNASAARLPRRVLFRSSPSELERDTHLYIMMSARGPGDGDHTWNKNKDINEMGIFPFQISTAQTLSALLYEFLSVQSRGSARRSAVSRSVCDDATSVEWRSRTFASWTLVYHCAAFRFATLMEVAPIVCTFAFY